MHNLIRSRGAAMAQRQVARQQLQAFLLRHGRIYSHNVGGPVFIVGSATEKFELSAHQVVCRIMPTFSTPKKVKARDKQIAELIPQWSMRPLIEALCDNARRQHNHRRQRRCIDRRSDTSSNPTLMAYFGLVPSERSSGEKVQA